MNRDERKPRRDVFKREQKAIRRILNDWDPIGVSNVEVDEGVAHPLEHEYDCLNHQLLSALHGGAGPETIGEFIRREMDEHFGLSVSAEEARSVADRLVGLVDDAPHPARTETNR